MQNYPKTLKDLGPGRKEFNVWLQTSSNLVESQFSRYDFSFCQFVFACQLKVKRSRLYF
jgi:hypothetical protein